MTFNKAKQILLNEIRKLKSKVEQKHREIKRIELEIEDLQKQADKLK